MAYSTIYAENFGSVASALASIVAKPGYNAGPNAYTAGAGGSFARAGDVSGSRALYVRYNTNTSALNNVYFNLGTPSATFFYTASMTWETFGNQSTREFGVTFMASALTAGLFITTDVLGRILVYYRASIGLGTLIATSTESITHSAEYLTFHLDNGTLTIYRDNDVFLTVAYTTFSVGFICYGVQFGQGDSTMNTNTAVAIRDVWIYTGDFQGPVRVLTLAPDADEALADWTPATGATGFDMVNGAYDAAKYVASSTPGNISDFSLAPITGITIYQVYSVVIQSNASKSSASADEYKTRLVEGLNVTDGATHNPPSTLVNQNFYDIFDTNPNSGIDWTPADVTAPTFEIGIEKV